MGWKLPADDRDFPGDSPERRAAALACAGALCNPEDVIDGYGEYNDDISDREHSKSQGCGSVEKFYDSHYSAEELTIKKPKEGEKNDKSSD
jgi:hypothetical protein